MSRFIRSRFANAESSRDVVEGARVLDTQGPGHHVIPVCAGRSTGAVRGVAERRPRAINWPARVNIH